MSSPKKSAHLFSYQTSRHFHCIATKWTSSRTHYSAPDGAKLCLVLLCGIGLTSDVWTPVVERLYNIESQLRSGKCLGSIWAIDRPSHGDSGVLNEPALAGCEGISPSAEYGAALAAFLDSPLLTHGERSNLVVVTHSAGVAALVYAPSAFKLSSRIRGIILIEPTIFDNCDGRIFEEWIRRLEKFFGNRKTSWASVTEAMSSNKGWQRFHPEVRHIIAHTFFRQSPGGITAKTSVAQETAGFKEIALGVDVGRRLGHILPAIPTHIVYGSRRDYWPNVLDQGFFRYVHKYQHLLASVTPIPGEGHFAPQEAPDSVAASIYGALASTVLSGPKAACKL
ncbi:Alpha/beta hydrolase fold-1 [Mycena vulgaris]|nr:Alpha/beta hydrolase fold-1 [Mycena vulgaris]